MEVNPLGKRWNWEVKRGKKVSNCNCTAEKSLCFTIVFGGIENGPSSWKPFFLNDKRHISAPEVYGIYFNRSLVYTSNLAKVCYDRNTFRNDSRDGKSSISTENGACRTKFSSKLPRKNLTRSLYILFYVTPLRSLPRSSVLMQWMKESIGSLLSRNVIRTLKVRSQQHWILSRSQLVWLSGQETRQRMNAEMV